MFKDVNIKQILRVMLVVLFAAFMLTACDSPKEGKTSLNADKRAALSDLKHLTDIIAALKASKVISYVARAAQ